MADEAKPTPARRGAIVLDAQVMLVGGAVALVGLVMAAFFLWMVPSAAAREAKAACTGLRATGPALCKGPDGQAAPCDLPMQAPDFTAIDNQGNKVALSQFKGKVVLLNFWASWCGVCKTEKPQLYKMAEDMASDDFVVIALASDRNWSDVLLAIVDAIAPTVKLPEEATVPLKDALAVYEKAMPNGLPFKVYLDPPSGQGNIGAIAASWGITAVPESALIDRQGRIRAYFVNKRDWDSPVAQTCLRSVIDE
jgi:thiol-disulfide isomerase/thioredoxin